MPRFSANLGFLWPDRPLLDRIDAAAAAGFRAIELHWPYATPAETVRERCAGHGLRLLGINTPPGAVEAGDFGLGALEGREDAFRESFLETAAWARAAGASSIHVMAGVVPPDRRTRATAVLVDNLRFAAQAAPDLELLLEAINQRDKPGYYYSTIEEASAVVGQVGAPNLKLMFDIYHVAVAQGDVTRRLERHLAEIGHVQIAAVPSRAEPDEGEIDYRHMFGLLDRLGYAGWVGCEYRPRSGTDDGLAWAARLGIDLAAA